MGQPLIRRSATKIDKMLAVNRRFACSSPEQRGTQSREAREQAEQAVKRYRRQLNVRKRGDGVHCDLEQAGRETDEVPWQPQVQYLALAVRQHFIARHHATKEYEQVLVTTTGNDYFSVPGNFSSHLVQVS